MNAYGHRYVVPLMFAALISLIASAAFAQSQSISDLSKPVSIAGTWKFQAGDQLGWADPEYSDDDWSSVTVPSPTPGSFESDTGIAWYRLTLRLNIDNPTVADQLGSLGLTIGKVMSAYEMYVGGELLGSVGGFPPNGSMVYDRQKIYAIPRSAIDDDGRLVLALRVWRYDQLGDNWVKGPHAGPFTVGNIGTLSGGAVKQAVFPNLLLATIYLVIGVYHILIARHKPELQEFLWFGLLATALSVYAFEASQLKFTVNLPYIVHKKLEFFCLYISPFLFTEVLSRTIKVKLNVFIRVFQYSFLLFALTVLVVPNQDIHFQTLSTFQYMAAVWSVGASAIIGWHAFHGSKPAGVILVLLLVLAGTIINDVVFDSNVRLANFGFAFGIILMSVVLAERYTNILSKLEMLVARRTADLQQSNTELHAALATKSQFLANMNHEFRTPMNAITGLTGLALKTDLNAQQKDYLTKVSSAATALGSIIDNTLDFSKLESNDLELKDEPFLMADLVNTVSSLATLKAEEKGLVFEVALASDVPAQLRGDEQRVAQVIGHLIDNGIKFTETGKVELAINVLKQTEDSVSIDFAVQDTGVGISAEQESMLFEAFAQADNSFSRQHGGAGLGLALSRHLIELMGSEITLDSQLGQGSCFSFTLDLPYVENSMLAQDVDQLEKRSSPNDLSAIQGATVLIVDDSEINLQIASELLLQAGLNTELAHDGQQAVAMVAENDYDCVLMDLQMPVMDGHTATQTIRSDPNNANLPIIALSANVSDEDREKAAQSGLNDHIPKPINTDALFTKLLQWIEPGERAPAIAANTADSNDNLNELPDELPGLAIREGLARVGGNAKLYMKLLQDMCKEYANVSDKLAQQIEQGELESGSQLAHKIRGIANNLGANDVGAKAEEIELSLKSDHVLPSNCLAELNAAISEVTEAAKQLQTLQQTDTETESLSDEEIGALLAQLAQALTNNDPSAADIAEKLIKTCEPGSTSHNSLSSIIDCLDMFDFTGAIAHLDGANPLAT